MGMLFLIIHLTCCRVDDSDHLSCYEFSSVSVSSVGFSPNDLHDGKVIPPFHELCSPTVLTSDLSLGETASKFLVTNHAR